MFIFYSILLGLLTGIIVGSFICKFYYNPILKGPDSNIIRKCIFKFNNKYYKFKPTLCIGF